MDEEAGIVVLRLRAHSQNSTVAASAMAERKTFGHLSVSYTHLTLPTSDLV